MAVRDFGNPPLLVSEGTATDPAQDDVLADSGALSAGLYEVRVIIGASAAAVLTVQRRNAANNANVGVTMPLRAPAGGSGEFIVNVALEASERVRVVMAASLTGAAEAVISLERLT